jgi:hypothetical protein
MYSAWTLKAVGLVIAGAATVLVAMTIARNVSIDSGQSDRTTGSYHEAFAISSPAPVVTPGPATFDADPDMSPHTMVHNGITVVSPDLLVPVIDLAALEAATGNDTRASATKNPRKHSRYGKRASSRRQTHWKAYGLAIR